jgi:hypothetical protein
VTFHSLRVQAEAEIDIAGATFWYEEHMAGLGREFLVALDELFGRIESSPRQFPELESGVRRALLGRFPYAVYFVESAGSSVVLAVLHQHRQPESWQVRT